jgi:hypothetical protein
MKSTLHRAKPAPDAVIDRSERARRPIDNVIDVVLLVGLVLISLAMLLR